MSEMPQQPPQLPTQQSPECREEQEQDDECFLQWIALVVLLACWLAEAYV